MNITNNIPISDEDLRNILKIFRRSNLIKIEDEIPNTYPVPFYRKWKKAGKNYENLKIVNKVISNSKPRSLYIGIPFCNFKCNYCVYSINDKYNKNIIDNYLNLLKKNFDLFIKMNVDFSNIERIYIGGGTPSVLDVPRIEDLFYFLESIGIPLSSLLSFSFEVSPESINKDKIKTLTKFVNRISIGVQDINEGVLSQNNRKTKFDTINNSIRILSDNIEYFNVDLIYGLVGQSESQWIDSTLFLIKNNVPEVTLYNCRVGINSLQKNRSLTPVEEKKRLLLAYNILKDHSYIQVRPFHWVRDENIKKLWKNYKYAPFSDQHSKLSGAEIGIGTSAVSHIDNFLFKNYDVNYLSKYKENLEKEILPVESYYRLNQDDKIIRKMLYGIEEGKFLYRELDKNYQAVLSELYQNLFSYKLINEKNGQYLLTKLGFFFYNNIEKEIIKILTWF